jgi:hypothetical protein
LQETAFDEGGEWSEGYLEKVSKEACEELEEKLNKVFLEWQEKYHEQPAFFGVNNAELYNLKTGEIIKKEV